MDSILNVEKFSIEKLRNLISKDTTVNKRLLINKYIWGYFREYFSKVNSKTMIVENVYIDKDYLEDYSSYYVRCFKLYERRCRRIHFFKKISFTKDQFMNFLSGDDKIITQKKLQKHYLGFIVIKPLPDTIFGRTCLVTYPKKQNRFYPIIREYKVNLFGINLIIESLAFQEQDRIVAACATSALWSVFHGTGILFHHEIPSPVKITESATSLSPMETRTFPNKGLNGEQIAHAIKKVNLEPFSIKVKNDPFILKSNLYAYIKCNIPLFLGMQLINIDSNINDVFGSHGVAITGYNLSDKKPDAYSKTIKLRASRINKIFVHDDQIGPFARMEFGNQTIRIKSIYGKAINNTNEYYNLTTSWINNSHKPNKVLAIPLLLQIPLYHKIRIQYEIIQEIIVCIEELIGPLILEGPFKERFNEAFEWDIYLSPSNRFKTELFCERNKITIDLLTNPLPKFIWRAAALYHERKVIEFIFDASDIDQGDIFICPLIYDVNFARDLCKISLLPNLDKIIRFKPAYEIIHWFARNKKIFN